MFFPRAICVFSQYTVGRSAPAALLLASAAAYAAGAPSRITLYPIPDEVRSTHYRVIINGRGTDVLHAATGYYLVNFDTSGPATITVTADDPHFWDAGVEVQPMRLGIRPVRRGATITFPIAGPGKLTITRPGDHFADADMLFLFANPPDTSGITAATPHVRYFGPGAHHENIDARSGDVIYLAGGAVVFGSLNLWQVHDVRVLGAGTILYDGPQDPHSDEGWMHKPNWHAIVMDNARNIEIDDITCITRSRSWQIQMKDSRHIGFYNIKVIGGNPNNANQDGMDWLGSGDTTVRNSFFRASDDVFSMEGNWDGYDLDLMRIPGHDVTNITIEDTVVSTSISNIVRVGWPQKTFNSYNFAMSDIDVIHSGYGACKVPFALFELWADPEGKGLHRGYRFQNIRLDDWYSLFNIDQPVPGVRDVRFSGVWAMDGPAMVRPIVKGDVSGVTLTGAAEQGFLGATAEVQNGAAAPAVEPAAIHTRFTYTGGLLKPRQPIEFAADAPAAPGRRFAWLFGDGTRAEGRSVRHAFPDADGTLLDGSGRFRVLLHITGPAGHQAWSSQQVVLAQPGRTASEPLRPSTAAAQQFQGKIHIPADGGYTFTLLTSLKATMSIGGKQVYSPKPRPQVCGAEGDAVQPLRLSVTLSAGEHDILIAREPGIENAQTPPGPLSGPPLLLWEGPGIERQPVPFIQQPPADRRPSSLPAAPSSAATGSSARCP